MRALAILVVVFILSTGTIANGQDLTFSSASSTENKLKLNQDLGKIFDERNTQRLSDYLQKNPKAVNQASAVHSRAGKYVAKVDVYEPAIHDLLDRYLVGRCNLEFIRLFLQFKPDLYVEYDGLPPFYRLLKYVAVTQADSTERAERLVLTFIDEAKIDLNREHRNLPPALNFLLNETYKFQGQSYTANYVSEAFLRKLIARGSDVKSFDNEGSSLLNYAVLTGSIEFQEYLIKSGVDVNKMNYSRKDVLYTAIAKDDTKAVDLILKSGYIVSPVKLYNLRVEQVLNYSNRQIVDLLVNRCTGKIDSQSEADAFVRLFPAERAKLLGITSYTGSILKTYEIPEFLRLVAPDEKVLSAADKQKAFELKHRFLTSATNVDQFMSYVDRYPLVNISVRNRNYYWQEENTELLLTELKAATVVLGEPLISELVGEVRSNRELYKAKAVEYKRLRATYSNVSNLARIAFVVPEDLSSLKIAQDMISYMSSLEYRVMDILGGTKGKVVDRVAGWGIYKDSCIIDINWYRSGVKADKAWDFTLAFNTGFEAFSENVQDAIKANRCTLTRLKYMGALDYDEVKDEEVKKYKVKRCLECVVDMEKIEIPKNVARETLFSGTVVDREYGVIKMMNGTSYKWEYGKRQGYEFVDTGILGIDKSFKTFDDMLLFLVEKCKQIVCSGL